MESRLTEHGNRVRQKIYDYLVEYFKENGYAPSVREIGEAVGLKSTSSVFSHLTILEEEGRIETRGNSPRAIKLIGYEFVKERE